jgi:hypothetical protein
MTSSSWTRARLQLLELLEARDRALAALKELEFDHRTGTVSDEDYRAQVGPLRREVAAGPGTGRRRGGGVADGCAKLRDGTANPRPPRARGARRGSSAAADDPAGEKGAVDARIAALQAEIIASSRRRCSSQLSVVVDELESAQSAVSSAQASVSSLEAELSSSQARLDRLTMVLGAQTRKLERLRAEYGKAMAILDARVRAAYIDEPPDMLAFLVSASSFDEIVDNVELLTRIGRQDQRIALQVAKARARTAAERKATIATKRLRPRPCPRCRADSGSARARDQLAAERDRLTTVRS